MRGLNDYFLSSLFFFVPVVLKIISIHVSFFMYRGRGGPWAPLWALANIECVAIKNMHVANNISCGAAGIFRGTAGILHDQHQIFENSLSVLGV